MHKFCRTCLKGLDTSQEACPQCGGLLVPLDDESLLGRIIDDRYEVMDVVGSGGMGVVYRAKQRYLDRQVAMKVLRRDLLTQSDSVSRFMIEAKAASALKSPHTVTIHDFGLTDDGLFYFTMELLEGESLSELLAREGPLPPGRAVNVVAQVCKSLAEAHERKIWHRDLKPENIFISRGQDGKEFAQVLDFGIAKVENSGERVTATGIVCGTPQYLSPDQARGQPADHRTDIYSLGIVLYEMLAGFPPFDGETPVEIVMLHIHEPPAPLARRTPPVVVSEELEDALGWALQKSPADRPDSVAEFAAALQAAVGEKPERPETMKMSMPGAPTSEAPSPGTEQFERTADMEEERFSDEALVPEGAQTRLEKLATSKQTAAGEEWRAEESRPNRSTKAFIDTAKFGFKTRPRTILLIAVIVGMIVTLLLVVRPWEKRPAPEHNGTPSASEGPAPTEHRPAEPAAARKADVRSEVESRLEQEPEVAEPKPEAIPKPEAKPKPEPATETVLKPEAEERPAVKPQEEQKPATATATETATATKKQKPAEKRPKKRKTEVNGTPSASEGPAPVKHGPSETKKPEFVELDETGEERKEEFVILPEGGEAP